MKPAHIEEPKANVVNYFKSVHASTRKATGPTTSHEDGNFGQASIENV